MLPTNKIILGTVQFGLNYGINNSTGKPSFDEIVKILDFAYEHNINTLDTADKYGDSIDTIAKYHQIRQSKTFKVNSKFNNNSFGDNLIKNVQQQLSKLQINQFEVYLFHSFSDVIKEELVSSMYTLKSNGLVHEIGVSIYTNDELKIANGLDFIDIIQLPYNLLDSNKEKNELIFSAKKNKKKIHARSLFLQGLYFKDTDSFPKKLKPLSKYIIALKKIAEDNNLTMEEMAILYVINNDNIDKILIGVDSEEHLLRNINPKNLKLTVKCIEAIRSIVVDEKELLNPTSW